MCKRRSDLTQTCGLLASSTKLARKQERRKNRNPNALASLNRPFSILVMIRRPGLRSAYVESPSEAHLISASCSRLQGMSGHVPFRESSGLKQSLFGFVGRTDLHLDGVDIIGLSCIHGNHTETPVRVECLNSSSGFGSGRTRTHCVSGQCDHLHVRSRIAGVGPFYLLFGSLLSG